MQGLTESKRASSAAAPQIQISINAKAPMDIPKLFDLKSSQFLVCTREIEADKARCL
jgi:hypothetical protein